MILLCANLLFLIEYMFAGKTYRLQQIIMHQFDYANLFSTNDCHKKDKIISQNFKGKYGNRKHRPKKKKPRNYSYEEKKRNELMNEKNKQSRNLQARVLESLPKILSLLKLFFKSWRKNFQRSISLTVSSKFLVPA